MAGLPLPRLRPGDVVAAVLPPEPEWVRLVEAAFAAEAALFPVDSRLPAAEVQRLLGRARPTVRVADGEARRVDGRAAPPGTAVIVATSGSTGVPRLVELTRDAVTAAVTASAAVLDAGPHDPWLCCIPVAHVGGLLLLLRHVVLGVPVLMQDGFDADRVCAAAGARFCSVVPTQLRRLLECGGDLTHFRALLVGGAALPGELAEATRRRVRAVATYGLTESCGGVIYDGRPLPDTEVRIGADGEVQLHGRTLMRGYRFDDAATTAAFTPDGWLRTRDCGVIDETGGLSVLGRLDDVIVSGGEKIWPHEVETALAEHPLVAEVAVAARPDPEWGQRTVAYVVPREPGNPPTLASLRDFVAERLPRHKAPRDLEVVDSLARTALGKLRRNRQGG